MGDVSQWFNSIPPLTRYWFGGTIGVSLLARFGLINPYFLTLDYTKLFYSFHIWRPLSALLYYPMGFPFLINLYFLYNYSQRLEIGHFAGRQADYIFMFLLTWICCTIIGLLSNMVILMDPMVMVVLYLWCQLNKDMIVTFWFGTQFKAMYFPWVLFAFHLIVSGGGLPDLVGILVGHFYFFLMYKYPQDFGGASLISTPQFLLNMFPSRRGFVAGFGQTPQYRGTGEGPAGNNQGGPAGNNQGGGGLFRGRGNTLGD